jgi:DNA mismatch repair protein MutS2
MISLYSNLPTIDLHGIDRDYAKILINDFIRDNFIAKNYKVIIIHGNGTGIIKKTTQETLRQNKYVENYKIDNFNSGMTIVEIRKKVDNKSQKW